MDPRLQRRVQRYGWDKAVPFYEAYWKDQLAPAQSRVLELAALRSGERVLDIACGTGLVTFPAADLVGKDGLVVATDISDKMIEFIHQDASNRSITHVRAMQMDAESLDVVDEYFDVSICSLGLMYTPYPLQAVREMHRSVVAGGRAVAAVWGSRSNCGWSGIFPVVDSRVSTDVCPLFFQLGTGDLLKSTFEQAGFSRVHTERIPTVLKYETPEAACGAAFAGGPVALAYDKFDEETRASAFADYLETIESFRKGTSYAIPGEFVIVQGWR
ncbi:MAG: class I SAM-dependent methyltransferase [Rhodothermales bacterium]|nr:class I SAM-dependent methyltransferase [Rhodothermales bacterium]